MIGSFDGTFRAAHVHTDVVTDSPDVVAKPVHPSHQIDAQLRPARFQLLLAGFQDVQLCQDAVQRIVTHTVGSPGNRPVAASFREAGGVR